MTASYAEQLAMRFGDAVPDGPAGLPDCPEIARILARRTHRAYAARPVEPALVRLLCLTALSASAKSDFQQASIIQVSDPARRAAIAKPFPAMPWIGFAPVFLVFCGDARRLERLSALRSHPPGHRNLEGLLY